MRYLLSHEFNFTIYKTKNQGFYISKHFQRGQQNHSAVYDKTNAMQCSLSEPIWPGGCPRTQELCQDLPDDCAPDPAAAAPAAGLLPPHGGAVVAGWCWLVTSGLHAGECRQCGEWSGTGGCQAQVPVCPAASPPSLYTASSLPSPAACTHTAGL